MIDLTRFTGSKAELVRHHCMHLLDPAVVWFDEAGPEATAGRLVHRMLAAVVNDGVLEVPEDDEIRALYAAGRAWLDDKRRAGWRAEVAFAYDVETDTARELEDPAGEDSRWYAIPERRAAYAGPGGPIRDSEICLRTDLVAMGADEDGWFAWVGDWKCHFGPELVDARAQLELGGLAVARAWGIERVKAVGIHLWTDRKPLEEPYELAAAALDDLADELLARASAEGEGPNEGPWCDERHCPARAGCGATAAAAASAAALIPAEQLARNRDFGRKVATNEDAAWLLVACGLLEELVAAKRAEVKAFADAQGGILQVDGKVFAGEEEIAEKADLTVPGARELLEELGLGFAIAETVTWSALKAVGGAPKADEAREQLRALGAVKSTPRRIYKARPVKGVAALVKVGAEPANAERRTA